MLSGLSVSAAGCGLSIAVIIACGRTAAERELPCIGESVRIGGTGLTLKALGMIGTHC